MLTRAKRDALFGVPCRTGRCGQLLPSARWELEHLTTVRFQGIDYRCHRRVKEPFRRLVEAWRTAGVLSWVRTLDRFYDFATCLDGTRLKRHCHGNAFDLNAAWNPIGRSAHSETGGTLPLLEVARAQGWWCGADRGPVARHFELERFLG